MPTRSESARDELVCVVGEHVGMLKVLLPRHTAVLEDRALREIIEAYERFADASAQDQRNQTTVGHPRAG